MSQLAYPHRQEKLGAPLPLGEREKGEAHYPYHINVYQLNLCREWVAHLRIRDYIPIPRYYRIGDRRFSVPGVGVHVLTLWHKDRFSWRRDPKRGLYNAVVRDERRQADAQTWIGCYLGITPRGMDHIWEMNNGGDFTMPQIADAVEQMLPDPQYFTLDPEPDWRDRRA